MIEIKKNHLKQIQDYGLDKGFGNPPEFLLLIFGRRIWSGPENVFFTGVSLSTLAISLELFVSCFMVTISTMPPTWRIAPLGKWLVKGVTSHLQQD